MLTATILSSFDNIDGAKFWPALSVWIHVDRDPRESDSHPIRKLVEAGCRNFLFSGNDSQKFEDFSDQIIEDFSKKLILTTSFDGSFDECFEIFLSTDNVQDDKIKSGIIVNLCIDGVEKDKFLSCAYNRLIDLNIDVDIFD